MTLAVWDTLSCCRINLGPTIRLPDGEDFCISIETTLILAKYPTPFAEMKLQTCKDLFSLLYFSPALQRTNCLLLQPNISNFYFINLLLSQLALISCWRYSISAATLPWRLLQATLLQTVYGCTWVPRVSSSSELLDIFSFRKLSLMGFHLLQ